MRIQRKVSQLIRKLNERGDLMAKKKFVVLSVEVGKFGSVVELPDNEETARWLAEGKIQEKK